MSEIRFLTSSDEHLSDLNPGFRCDSYKDEILGMLEWQGELAKKFNATAVLRGGDFFHVKAANKTTMKTIATAAKIHRNYSCPVYSVIGNHDVPYNDLSAVNGQPLGVLLNSGVFLPLVDEIFNCGTLSVRVTGIDYTVDIDNDLIKNKVMKKQENYSISVIHALAAMAPSEKIQTFFNETIFDYRDLVFNGCPDVYVFGHYHKDQGVKNHAGTDFVNLGAISRGSLTFENLERKPKVSLITINSQGVSVEEVVVPHKDASEIFDLDLKKKIEKEKSSLDDFIASLRDNVNMSNSDDISQRKKDLDKFPDDVKKLAFQILSDVEEMDGYRS